jgi:putative DNA primase/helicase
MLTTETHILPLAPAGIPPSLTEQDRWVCWQAVPKQRNDGTIELTKQPRRPDQPLAPASSTDAITWGTFAQAAATYESGHATGIGFVLGDGIMGIDLDAVRDPHTGTLEPAAQAIVDRLDTYTEVSPSGTGVKLLLRGTVPQGRKRPADGIDVEIYPFARYFTITGHRHPGTPPEVAVADEARTAEVMRLWEQMGPRTSQPQPEIPSPSVVNGCYSPTDNEVIEAGRRACNGFAALWDGDSSKHGGDESAGDQGLANHLAWLCGPNGHGQVRRLMMQSGRRRPKFETHKTYLDRTIGKAYEGGRDFYEWRQAAGHRMSVVDAPAVENTSALVVAPASAVCGPAVLTDFTTLTDEGLALRLVAEARGTIRYLADQGVWLNWTGTHWERDKNALGATRIARSVGTMLWREVRLLPHEQVNAPMVNFARLASSRKSVDAMVALARSDASIETRSKYLDADSYLLNCRNGTLDLRTLDLRPHNPDDLLTKVAGVDFDPVASRPRWDRFVDEVTCGDRELARFLQRSFGVALSGDVSCEAVWIHHGDGANGKSTALDVISAILGDYAGTVAADALLVNPRAHEKERALVVGTMFGKRLTVTQENDAGLRLSEGIVKQLTGRDTVQARFLHNDPFDVSPTWHPHLVVNHKPVIRGTDLGIWRRVHLVPWAATFGGDKRDDGLRGKLMAEASGILNWLVKGFMDYRDCGLSSPEAVKAATSEYRQESDRFGEWLTDYCEADPRAITPSTELYASYRAWCEETGDYCQNVTAFGRELTRRGYAGEKRGGRKVRVGLRLKP